MRLLAFTHRGRRSIGAELDADQVLDFSLAGGLPSSMRAFLELGDGGMTTAKRLLEKPVKGAILQRRDLHVLAPLSGEERPKITCIGLNYADHAAESGSKVPDEPMMFAKYYTTIWPGRQHRGSAKPQQARLRGGISDCRGQAGLASSTKRSLRLCCRLYLRP